MYHNSIGIYFGSDEFCIGSYFSNQIEIIQNFEHNTTTPSIVSFTENNILIGESAKNNMIKNPKNTIYGIRKLIGKKYDDPEIQQLIKTVPYKIEKDIKSNKPKIIVEYQKEIKSYYPEEIFEMIIRYLIKCSEKFFLNDKIENIIITVPVNFNYSQTQIIEELCKKIGIKGKIIKEPISACIAYRIDESKIERNILVLSIEKNELNISIVNFKNLLFKIISNVHQDIGREDFDNQLFQYLKEQFQNETGIDIQYKVKAIERLKKMCKTAINKLCNNLEFTISIDSLANNEDFYFIINRAAFEYLCSDLFNICHTLIEKALKKSGLIKSQIHEIILTEHSSNIPNINKLIDIFENAKLKKNINPNEIYAIGAAIASSQYERDLEDNNSLNESYSFSKKSLEIENIKDNESLSLIKDINDNLTPLSLGIDKGDGIMEVIFPRMSKIPCKNSIKFNTIKSYDSFYKIYEGERKLVKYNNLLLKNSFNNFSSRKISKNQIEIIFEIDIEKYLFMTVKENENNIFSTQIKLNLNKSQNEIKKIIEDAKKNEQNDEIEVKKIKKEVENNDEYNKLLLLLQEENEKLKQEINNLKNQNKKNVQEIENNKNEINNYEKEIILHKNKLNNYEIEITNIKKEMDKNQTEKEYIQNQLMSYEKENKILQNNLNKTKNEYNEINTNYKMLIQKKKKIEDELENTKKILEKLKQKFKK